MKINKLLSILSVLFVTTSMISFSSASANDADVSKEELQNQINNLVDKLQDKVEANQDKLEDKQEDIKDKTIEIENKEKDIKKQQKVNEQISEYGDKFDKLTDELKTNIGNIIEDEDKEVSSSAKTDL